LKTAVKTVCEAYLLQRGEKRSSSGETGRPASAPTTAWVPLEAGRAVALFVDESGDWGRGSGSKAHGDPGRAGSQDLPRAVCARDWPMSLPNHPVERTGARAARSGRSPVRSPS
jgi:hypothetical protein